MSTTSALLRMTLQALNENTDTWGSVLNVSALQLLEDGIAGAADVVLATAADYTLDDTAGGPTASDGARYAILDISGTPGGATNIIVPTRNKIYLASNQSDQSVVIKTSAGTGPTIIAGEAQWVFCDGTNVLAASAATATSAGTAALATDSSALIGVAGANFAQKALAQTFTAGQVTERVAVLVAGGSGVMNINCALGNAFYHLTTETFTVAAPTNATNGQQFTLAVQQGGGGPHSIGFASSTFIAAGGTAPTLSTTAGQVDYLAFEYVTGLAAPFSGSRWVVSQLKNVADV